jgi:hypothetical protein
VSGSLPAAGGVNGGPPSVFAGEAGDREEGLLRVKLTSPRYTHKNTSLI